MELTILSKIQTPKDIKNLSFKELQLLVSEIRHRIIEVMSVNGGHLASNLGVVELAIALHKVFDSPKDKFIWDVSHQTYAHKLLTGRNPLFSEIRKFKGLCGFSHPKESEHDHFQAGHAGTAMSLALGVAKNRELTKRDEYIIPIIGDATLTCGLALEALNNIPPELKKFIIILNDNAMSISKNVGAISDILSKLFSNPFTQNRAQQETESVKSLVSPAAYFEHYGLSYLGPIDGHDIKELIDVFEKVKDMTKPVIIHVLTRKGEGMDEAMKNPISYHGARPFSRDTGKFFPNPSNNPTFPKIFGSHLLKMAEKDPSLVVVTPAMSAGSCLDEFMTKFPDRCIDVGIAESHAVTYSGGIAFGGKMKIVTSIYSTFLQRAFDNLFHDVCLQQLPVIFAIDRAGISGPDGSTHHGIYDISFLNAMPNMIIAQPRNGRVLKELLESSFSWKRPTAIRYPNLSTEDFSGSLNEREMGKGEILVQGEEILIIALGHMSNLALATHELLKNQGLSSTVLDPVFVKPLDTDLLCDLLLTHQKIITIEEHSVISGMGSIINNFLIQQGYSNIQVLNLGIPETFLEHGSHQDLLNEIGLTPDQIFKKIVNHFGMQLKKSALIT